MALPRSEEHTSELQSHLNLVCRLLLEKKNNTHYCTHCRILSAMRCPSFLTTFSHSSATTVIALAFSLCAPSVHAQDRTTEAGEAAISSAYALRLCIYVTRPSRPVGFFVLLRFFVAIMVVRCLG